MNNHSLNEFRNNHNLNFNNLDLLLTALTHRSFSHESKIHVENNERLEFLGDAILTALVADLIVCKFPDMSEGELTRLRAALVRGETLAKLAIGCDLAPILRMGSGEESSGGRQKTSILAGAFEALVGAIYLDQGFQYVVDFCEPLFLSLLPDARNAAESKDTRSRLQEWAQAKYGITPHYRYISQCGPKHEARFEVEVRVNEKIRANGWGTSKQHAAHQAAKNLLKQLAIEHKSG